ncbi:unnamed protein product [Prorocentrum cordatum]|uniref:MIT domain-containing protein n=1 Tax=Prorocentrum cordatum TaxID=2364126 RepID=A0ABN9T463_9DINO|nr:unnamed protein product [Polarella glacialis]
MSEATAAPAGCQGGAAEACGAACSGAAALRRITGLLAGARRADAQGEYRQAFDQYAEALRVQRSLASAPLGSIGKSLRAVAVRVEGRLQQLRQLLEGDTRVDASSCSSGSRGSAAPAAAGGAGGSWAAARELQLLGTGAGSPRPSGVGQPPAAPRPATGVSLPTSETGRPEERPPPSARGRPRPATRDGGRPTTRDGVALPLPLEGGRRQSPPAESAPRPATRSEARSATASHQQLFGLDGMRPSTREERRLQQMIEGEPRRARPGSPRRESKGESKGASGSPSLAGTGRWRTASVGAAGDESVDLLE